MLRNSSILIALLALAPSLCAQAQSSPSFAIGGGVLVADHGPFRQLRSQGVTAFLRIALPTRLPAILDATIDHVSRNNDIVSGPCPPPPAACGSVFVGPTTILTLAPALQVAKRVPPGAWLFHVGPSVHWLVDRKPGSAPLALGLRGGLGFHVGHAEAGLLLSVDYVHFLRSGTQPDWLLPFTVGWEF